MHLRRVRDRHGPSGNEDWAKRPIVHPNPTLVVNPADDPLFAQYARILVDHGVSSMEELEHRLHTLYPTAPARRT